MTNRLALAAAAAGLIKSGGRYTDIVGWENKGNAYPPMTSNVDGQTWTSSAVRKMVAHKSKIWAVAGWSTAADSRLLLRTSDGGLSWTTVDLAAHITAGSTIRAFDASPTKLVAFAGRYVNSGYDYVDKRILVSDDEGATWRNVATIPPAGMVQCVRYINGRFVALGEGDYSGNNTVTSCFVGFSLDGEVWSWSYLPLSNNLFTRPDSVAYGNGVYCVVATRNTLYTSPQALTGSYTGQPITYTSTDLTNWTANTANLRAITGVIDNVWFNLTDSICFIPRLNKFILVTYTGKVVSSVDGVNWSLVSDLVAQYPGTGFGGFLSEFNDANSIIDDGQNLLIRAGQHIFITPDGTNPQSVWIQPIYSDTVYGNTIVWDGSSVVLTAAHRSRFDPTYFLSEIYRGSL